jgi:hypothetical protein
VHQVLDGKPYEAIGKQFTFAEIKPASRKRRRGHSACNLNSASQMRRYSDCAFFL